LRKKNYPGLGGQGSKIRCMEGGVGVLKEKMFYKIDENLDIVSDIKLSEST
jgi:hypothetical protein